MKQKTEAVGQRMYNLVAELFPIGRSITGDGVRQTLAILKKIIPIEVREVKTGTHAFDWTVPREWNIRSAYIEDAKGNRIVDYKNSTLHVVSYSVPVDKKVSLSELQKHLYSLPDQPEAIPYVTSYYEERWGFCIPHKIREKLIEGTYKVFIDSELKDGSLTYGELIIRGRSKKEVFMSTYVCHPSMANNELSGPVVAAFLAQWLLSKPRRFTYRIIFIPETIGSIVYVSRHLKTMKRNTIAGFNLSCVGDARAYGYLPTRAGDTYADKIVLNVLSSEHPDFIAYSFLDTRSDERRYNAPGIDLPVCGVTRSKYGTYPEYHTSLDDLSVVSLEGLAGAYEVLKKCLTLIEENRTYKMNCLGEPQLGKRGLYPTIGTLTSAVAVEDMIDFISYADGKNDLVDISNKTRLPVKELYPIVEKLTKAGLVSEVT